MTDTIGRGVIEVSADASKLKVGIADAQRSLKGLGDSATKASKSASDSIDRYVKRLETQAAVQGKSTRETELYRLSLRGASTQQIAAANSALKLSEAYERGISIGNAAKRTMLAIGAAAVTGGIAAAVAFDRLVNSAAKFQDIAEKTGDSAENIASLSVAAATGGVQIETIASASAKLTKGLTGVDDESKAAGAALAALGINIEQFKALKPADQFEAIAKSLDGFQDGTEKTAVAMALFGKSGAELLPFLKELGKEGSRQVLLTEAQIALADEYADRQAKLRGEISLQAQAFAIGLIPTISKYQEILVGVFKDQENMAIGLGLFKGVADGTVAVFRTMIVGATLTAGAFQVLGKAIAGYYAVSEALLRLDIKGAKSIGQSFRDDVTNTIDVVDKFNKKLFDEAPKFADPRRLGPVGSIAEQAKAFEPGKPKIKFSGATKPDGGGSAKDTVAQEARAQLAFDLEQIRKGGDASLNTIANQLRLLEAQRAAALVEERAYYAQRNTLLNNNTAAQEAALQKELARLQAEQLLGKEKIDNDRKILDVQAKLAKVREDAATSVQVLAVQEAAAIKVLAQQYRDAEDAANDFLQTIRTSQARDLAGVGIGGAARDRLAGRAQIEDRFSDQRRALEKSRRDAEFNGSFGPDAQAKYDEELDRIRRFQTTALAEYEVFARKRSDLDTSFAAGASESIANYLEEVRNVASQSEALFTNAFKGMEDALVNFVKTGKLDFKSLADSIITDLIRIEARKVVSSAASGLAGLLGLGGSGTSIGSKFPAPSDFLAFANGGRPPVGVPSLVGERGPELFVPSQAGTIIPNNALGGGATVQQTITIDARGADAGVVPMIEAAMRRTKAETLAAVQANANRGGGFARSMGRA